MKSVQLKSQKSIGELIHYYRLIKGYSQKELAKRLHVTVSAISSWERGQNKPGLDVAMIIAQDIGISLDEFFLYRKPTETKTIHHLSDTITMVNAYVDIQSVEFPANHQLALTFKIKGLSLTLEMVEHYSRQIVVHVDKEKVPVQSNIVQRPDEKVSFSPEVEAAMSPLRVFECRTTFAYQPDQDIEVQLTCFEHEERYVISGTTIRLLHQDHVMHHKTVDQQKAILASNDHQEVLQFLAKSTTPQRLQDYIKRLYL